MQSGVALTMAPRPVAHAQRVFDTLYDQLEGPTELQGRRRVEYLLGKSTEEVVKAWASFALTSGVFPGMNVLASCNELY